MSKKYHHVLVIIITKKSSFNAAVRDTFIDEAKKIGHKIDLNKYIRRKTIKILGWIEKPNEQILNYRKRLEQADVFL
jgi:putative NADPH-quinone reductase